MDRGLTASDSLPPAGFVVDDIDLRENRTLTDSDFEVLDGLTEIRELTIYFTPITDAGLKHLANLRTLEFLNLAATPVGDSGMEHLSGLKKLKTLFLGEGWLGQSEAVPQWRNVWGFAALSRQPPNARDCQEDLPHPGPRAA